MPMMPGIRLTDGQWNALVGLGAFFWVAGVIQIRFLSRTLFGSRVRQALSYLASFPMSYIMLRVSELLLGLHPEQRLAATTVMSVSALFLDGSALMWFPSLYEDPSLTRIQSPLAVLYSRQGAAWLLWTFGAGLAIALKITPN